MSNSLKIRIELSGEAKNVMEALMGRHFRSAEDTILVALGYYRDISDEIDKGNKVYVSNVHGQTIWEFKNI